MESKSLDWHLNNLVPPHNIEAERDVIGGMFINPRVIDEVMSIVRADDFYQLAHQTLFRYIVKAYEESGKIDTTLIAKRLISDGLFEEVGGATYIASVIESTPVAAHAALYAKIVKEKALIRSVIRASMEIIRDAYDPSIEPEKIIASAEEKIFSVEESRTEDTIETVEEVKPRVLESIKRRQYADSIGVPTGFKDLDRLCGGFHGSELLILAARPGVGKTALALNIADHVVTEAEKPVLFISLEMSKQELITRLLCARSEVNGISVRNGLISNFDLNKLQSASVEFDDRMFYIDDSPSRTIAEIASSARRFARKHKEGLGLIVIDYLQLIEPENTKCPRQEQVSKISRKLKQLARRLNTPVLCLAQLNRQAEAKDQRPKLSHLRESGAIEQDADIVMFIHRKDYGLSKEEAKAENVEGLAELIVAKQRNGPTGEINLVWKKEYGKFVVMAPVNIEKSFIEYSGSPF